jgi:16S rRNA (guanine966-N2)-methyltransferase
VLGPRLEGCTFLDAYAGSGAVGIEALSRGAKRVILIERNPAALAVIQANLRILGIEREALVVRDSAATSLRNHRPDIAFIDPPYEKTREYANSLLALSEAGCPVVIAQHASRAVLEDSYGLMTRFRVLRQGDNSLSFYERACDRSPA